MTVQNSPKKKPDLKSFSIEDHPPATTAASTSNLRSAPAARRANFATETYDVKYHQQTAKIKIAIKNNKPYARLLGGLSENGLKALLADFQKTPNEYGTPEQQKTFLADVNIAKNQKFYSKYATSSCGNFLTKVKNTFRKYAPFIFPVVAAGAIIGPIVGGIEGVMAENNDAMNHKADNFQAQSDAAFAKAQEIDWATRNTDFGTENVDAFLTQHKELVYTIDSKIPAMDVNSIDDRTSYTVTPELDRYADKLIAEGKEGRFANPDNNVSITIKDGRAVIEYNSGSKYVTPNGNGSLQATHDGRLIGADLRGTGYDDAVYLDENSQAERDARAESIDLQKKAYAANNTAADMESNLFTARLAGYTAGGVTATLAAGTGLAAGVRLNDNHYKKVIGMNQSNVNQLLNPAGTASFKAFDEELKALQDQVQTRINEAQTAKAERVAASIVSN